MTEPMECPRCGEIELVGRKDGDLITYECPCGHEENMKGQWWQNLDDDEVAIQEFLT